MSLNTNINTYVYPSPLHLRSRMCYSIQFQSTYVDSDQQAVSKISLFTEFIQFKDPFLHIFYFNLMLILSPMPHTSNEASWRSVLWYAPTDKPARTTCTVTSCAEPPLQQNRKLDEPLKIVYLCEFFIHFLD